MSNFYVLKYTDYRYMMLGLDALDIIRKAPRDIGLEFDDIMAFSRRDTRFASWWREPEVSFTPNEGIEKALIPDVVIWPAGAALVLSPKAYRMLGDLLKVCGELLPVRVMNESQPFWIFNCLVKKNVDPAKSAWKYEGDVPIQIDSIGFTENDDDPVIFKTDFDNCSFLYCSERFKAAVVELGLEGISFRKLP